MKAPTGTTAEPPASAWVWRLFLVWTAVGFLVVPADLDPAGIREWLGNGILGGAAVHLHRAADAVWMSWAALVCLTAVARATGWRVAALQFGLIALGSAAVEWMGATTGFPFGPYEYGHTFGWRIGGVLPFTIPLAWFVVVSGSRSAVRLASPRAAAPLAAVAAGILAVLTDVNLEHVAWHVRGYWTWFPDSGPHPPGTWPPARNFVSWFVLATIFAALAGRIEESHAGRRLPATGGDPARPAMVGDSDAIRRPAVVLALMNALFLATRAFATGAP